MGVDIEPKRCGCGNICHEPTTCEICESQAYDCWQYGGGYRAPDLLCQDCLHQCINCPRRVCEFHLSGRECIACSGPSDDQLAAQ